MGTGIIVRYTRISVQHKQQIQALSHVVHTSNVSKEITITTTDQE